MSKPFKLKVAEEEERMDMFEFFARQRLEMDQRRRQEMEVNTHHPEQKPKSSMAPNSSSFQTDHTSDKELQPQKRNSRDYLIESKIVKNMKTKWEEFMRMKNPPLRRTEQPKGLYQDAFAELQAMMMSSIEVKSPTQADNPARPLQKSSEVTFNVEKQQTNTEQSTNTTYIIPMDANGDSYRQTTETETNATPQPQQTQTMNKAKCSDSSTQHNKCTQHVITNFEIFSVDSQPPVASPNHIHHNQRHRFSLNQRKSIRPSEHESVEGLLRVEQHFPEEIPALPQPIQNGNGTMTDYVIGSEKYEQQSGKGNSGNQTYNADAEEHVHQEHKTWQNNKLEEQSNEYETGTTTSSSNSIALEMEGPGYPPRRATFTHDFLTLQLLNKDFNETIQDEVERKSDQVFKSKSELNIVTQDAKTLIKSLSRESLIQSITTSKGKKSENQRSYKICHKCKKLIKPNDATYQLDGGQQIVWHNSCFVCKTCHTQLGDVDHLFYENEPYCYQHYVLVAHVPKCHACEGLIFDASYTSAGGFYWHKDHFFCNSCRVPIVDTKYVFVDGRVYCFSCHQKEFLRVCQTCHQKILPRQIYVQSGNYFWHSNDTCLHCEACQQSLMGHSLFFRKSGKLFCNRYCALGRGILQ